MQYLIAGVLSFFSDFFKNFTLQALIKTIGAAVFIGFAITSFSMFLALLYFGINVVLFVFNKVNDFFSFLDGYLLNTTGDVISVVFSILRTFGVFEAFNDVFAIFSPFFVSYLAFKISVLIYAAFSKVIKFYLILFFMVK